MEHDGDGADGTVVDGGGVIVPGGGDVVADVIEPDVECAVVGAGRPPS